MSSKRKTAKRKAAAPKKKPATRKAAKSARAKSTKRTAPKKPASKRPSPKRKPSGATKTAGRRPAPRKPAARRKATAPKRTPPAPLAVTVDRPTPPRPPSDDEIEVSGVWGRVRYSESDPDAEVKEIFGHYDRDRSGQINASEFARILEALGMELEEHDLKVALLDVDRDGDGKIGWDEFLAWWKSMGN